ncbi:uncharacterized protein I303_106523 [Kwoniella dejecticola CBS 10117]|uniref:Nucleoside phosphatase n=1 Tax=Kwoniella dejecticola CBS 10117 TaxID=1296121 RepID=A0AAJ8KUB2_9TREE
MAPSISSSTTHYALVIDAGSSGSRLQIYSWRDPDLERAEILQEVSAARRTPESIGKSRWWWNKDQGKGKGKESEHAMEAKALRRLVRVGKGVEGEDWVKRVEPGISTVRAEDIPEYLAPLLSHGLRHIPPSQHASTPIYILATAGMRLIPESTREAILKASCNLIKDEYPFKVEGPSSAGPCGENVRVISGEEEGMWGWVAVNYLMDGFAEAPPNSLHDSVTPVDVNHHSPTFGFLDMGGASTQLAFSPSPNEIASSHFPEDELHKIQLRLLSGENVEWPVFVASWLGFGTNRARERYIDYLVQTWKSDNKESDFEVSGTEFQKPIEDPCLPLNLEYDLPSSSSSTSAAGLDSSLRGVKIKGTGSFSQCLETLTPLLEHSKPCPTEHCLFAGLPTPHIDFEKHDQRGFIGISEYWYTSQQVLGLGGIWDWGEWEKGMNAFCARDWQDIQKQVGDEKGWRGAEVDLSRMQMQCFKGAWISNVLHEGIGIPRLVDAGGNATLTGGDLGETNEEAERRAKEKGLFETKGKSKTKTHFQSMDEIGETAISWTLGKMVIEASKAIQPRSTYKESMWTSRIKHLPFKGLEDRLEKMGIQTLWAYGFVSFFVLACLFNYFRRKFHWRHTGLTPKRNRKSSVGANDYNPEEGFLSDSSISLNGNGNANSHANGNGRTRYKAGTVPGSLRLWTLRISNLVRRSMPFAGISKSSSGLPRRGVGMGMGISRHNSMPLPMSLNNMNLSSSSDSSNPSSPTTNGFFVPAYTGGNLNGSGGNLGVPTTNRSGSGSTSPDLSLSLSPINGLGTPLSPPGIRKTTSRSGKSRQVSSSLLSSAWEKSSSGSGGWNDPPSSLFDDNSNSVGSRSRESTYNNNINLNSTSASAISRNSSRVNLSELGLAQRSASRAGTPAFDEDH